MLRFWALALAVCATACSSDSSAPAPSKTAAAASAATPDSAHGDIAWRSSDVAAAFAEAKAQNKPVFLYWGAVWCPPCQQIKATIFKRREFIERARLVVPVYLDGDSPSAQKYGDEFGVVGYPTMIVFKADGTEITRLPGGVDIELYDAVLDSALTSLKSVSDIVAAANRDPASLAPGDWRLLAYYSWETGEDRVVSEHERAPLLKRLVQHCPASDPEDCVRLKLALAEFVATTKIKPTVTLDQRDLVSTLNDVLENTAPRKSNLDSVLYSADDLVKVATVAGSPERKALVERWKATLELIAKDESVSKADRVATGYAVVSLAKLDAPADDRATAGKQPWLPADVLAIARERAAWGDQVTTDPYERQAVINTAGAVLTEAGLDKEANDLLTRELARSKSPYYFMLDIADLAQKAGRKTEALQWLERAYNESQGPATRFQWGVNYLLGLIEMAPDDGSRIERVGLAVFDELAKSKEGIYQRTRIRLERLDHALSEWNTSGRHAAVITALRGKLHEVCAPMTTKATPDSMRKSCNQFLAKA